jgi:hypothetical protein
VTVHRLKQAHGGFRAGTNGVTVRRLKQAHGGFRAGTNGVTVRRLKQAHGLGSICAKFAAFLTKTVTYV